MDSHKSSVVIAAREAPMRRMLMKGHGANSIIKYSDEFPNTLVVDGNIYSFDCAFNSSVTQSEIYDVLFHPLVLKVLSGYDCTALAYGQTGTGKSYTMGMTAELLTEDQLGVVPRSLNYILKYLSEEDNTALVSASFIEIYNEKAYDLLACDAKQPIAARGQRQVTAGIRKPLRNQIDLKELLQLGATNRHVRPTNMNGNSSRSHAIVTIHVTKGQTSARLNIVDLAGSEGVRRTGHEGMARTEGVYINMGLLGINKVLMAMSAGNTVIPYRDSILTLVLQESFRSHAYLTLLACVSPHPSDLSETNSTMRFAMNAKRVRLTQRLSQQLKKIQHQVCVTQKSSKATMDPVRGVQPSSTTIKRPVVVRSSDQMQPKLRRRKRIAALMESKASIVPTLSTVSLFKNKNDNSTNELSCLNVSEPKSLCHHRAMLLDFLNAGGVTELQTLPYIGQKTAVMLVMQRSCKGHFKNWREVEELPIWRGNGWIRFAKANCILP